jgi:hypothetical protein
MDENAARPPISTKGDTSETVCPTTRDFAAAITIAPSTILVFKSMMIGKRRRGAGFRPQTRFQAVPTRCERDKSRPIRV